MAIEIKELIIKVTVNNSPSKTTSEKKHSVTSIDKKQIIKECVEKVMEKLEMKSLR
jgi:hypothetical protein